MAINPKDKPLDENRDPITGEPGAHPIGTGLGAAGAGATGAAIGMAAGPVGAAIGAVVGAVAGGLAGKGIAEAIDPTAEATYWRDNYHTRPYASKDATYDDYAPAYQYGWESRAKSAHPSFQDAEAELKSGWEATKHNTKLGWDKAKHATRDAWERI